LLNLPSIFFIIGEDIDHANVIVVTSPKATYMVLAGDLVPADTTLVTPAVKFLVWENTMRKELQPLEVTSKLTTGFAYNDTSRVLHKECYFRIDNLTFKRIEMHVKDAIATKQNVTLCAN